MIVPIIIFIFCVAGVIAYHAALLSFVVGLWLALTHLHAITYVLTHPWQVLLYASGYFLSGALVSVAKWWFEETERVEQARIEWRRYYTDVAPDGSRFEKKSWSTYAKENKTSVERHKSDIIAWITFWPIVGIWTLINKPVRRLGRRIYAELQGVYQRITDAVWK